MDKITIYHNHRCSTSRKVLELLHEKGFKPNVILYLETSFDRALLKSLIKSMGIKPRDLLRKKENIYSELSLSDPKLSDEEIIKYMVEHPILIERPIVVTSLGTRLCRPIEKILEILP